MKYNKRAFTYAVKCYEKIFGKLNGKSVLLVVNFDDVNAYYSVAPISNAVHNLKGDLHVIVKVNCSSKLDVLMDVWKCYNRMRSGINDKKTTALADFIEEVKKKAGDKFEKIFRAPDYIITSNGKCFSGSLELPYKSGWFKSYRYKELLKTSSVIWEQLYNLKKKDIVGITFELVPPTEKLELPLEDYLDNFVICRAMASVAMKRVPVRMGASTPRFSALAVPERVSELSVTLLGCELEKEINEPVFNKFKRLSKLLRINRLKPSTATFFIHGKGFHGKHLFGEVIGYPTKNRKSRWQTPGGFIYKLDYYPQTAVEPRDPIARIGFTETLPIDIFIETCNIDWMAMQKRNEEIVAIVEKSNKIVVEGKKLGKFQTKFEVGLVKPDGTRRWARTSGVEIRELISREYLKRTGIRAGTMANLPGGEMFVTPEYLSGTFVGDVVVSIDRSYKLSAKNPLVVKANGSSYTIIKGP